MKMQAEQKHWRVIVVALAVVVKKVRALMYLYIQSTM